MDPRGGNHEQQARYFAGLAVPDGTALTEAQEELARAVLEIVLLAGLPPYNLDRAAVPRRSGIRGRTGHTHPVPQVTAAEIGYWTAHNGQRDATVEQIAAALGANKDETRKTLARFGRWSPYR